MLQQAVSNPGEIALKAPMSPRGVWFRDALAGLVNHVVNNIVTNVYLKCSGGKAAGWRNDKAACKHSLESSSLGTTMLLFE